MIKSVKEATAEVTVTSTKEGVAPLKSTFLDLAILKYLGSHSNKYCNHINAAVEGVAAVETTRTVGGRLKALETLGYAAKTTNPKNSWIYWNVTPEGTKFLTIFERRAGVEIDVGAMVAAEAKEFDKKEKTKKGDKKTTASVDLSAFEDESEAAEEAPVEAGAEVPAN